MKNWRLSKFLNLILKDLHLKISKNLWTPLKGTQDWEFFWLRFWNLYYFFVSYVKILRFYRKIVLFGPLLGELRIFPRRCTRQGLSLEIVHNWLTEACLEKGLSVSQIWCWWAILQMCPLLPCTLLCIAGLRHRGRCRRHQHSCIRQLSPGYRSIPIPDWFRHRHLLK